MQLLKFIALIILLNFSTNSISLSQNDTINANSKLFDLYVMTGMASYDIGDLSKVRDISLKSLPFPAIVTDDYPRNPLLSSEFIILGDRFDFGIGLTWMSTGTRVHYADYSGEYKFENVINYLEYTLILRTKKRSQKPLNVQFALEVGKSLLTLKYMESTRVFDQKQSFNEVFTNSLWIIKLGGRLSYQIDNFEPFIGALYCMEPQNQISLKFSGIRGLIGIGLGL